MPDAVPAPTVAIPGERDPGEGSLVYARGLTKRFGEFTAVDGIDIDVQRGEALARAHERGPAPVSALVRRSSLE